MLNELLVVERGARQAGFAMTQPHPDVKDCGRIPKLLVRLTPDGNVASVWPLPHELKCWTIRDGNHNSFPFIQPQLPLLAAPVDDERRQKAVGRKNEGRRAALLALADAGRLSVDAFENWPGDGLLNRLQERRKQLASLSGADAGVVLATIDRFLLACDRDDDGRAQHLLRTIIGHLVDALHQTAEDAWLEVATALLIGKFNSRNGRWESNGALLFEADAFSMSIIDPRTAVWVSAALNAPQEGEADRGVVGRCGLTGNEGLILSDKFHQPNLPYLGQTYLFAKNSQIPANDRYGRFAADAMPVGRDTANRLAAAIIALTADGLRNKTWREVPDETSKQNDLLLAFVEVAPNAPTAGALAEDEEDYSEEDPGTVADTSESVAVFEKRAERLIEAVRGKVTGDFRQTPVHLAVLRKVDPANRKVVYAGAPSVGELYSAAVGWAAGERNVPLWLTLPVQRKGEKGSYLMAPPHIAPLAVVGFSKQIFLHSGKRPEGKKKEQTGLPAAEALGLFLESADLHGTPGQRRATRVLRLVLARRAALVSGAAHAQRCKGNRKNDPSKDFDGREVLRTITVLGLLLHKLGRPKEAYMSDTAFKLGQLLAAADMVHAGYCADVRGGGVPPSLLGNQVFTMAQAAPVKALATLCRRWKPYDGWAKKAARERSRAEKLAGSKNADERQRGWDIRKALRHAREIGRLADELGPALADYRVNDTFRAELLLGYMAGLPKTQRDATGDDTQAADDRGQED